MDLLSRIQTTTAYLKSAGLGPVDGAIILGTGLGNSFIEILSDTMEWPYDQVPEFPEATVEFHHGKIIYGKYGGKDLLVFNGRFHYYEGHSMEDITFPVRIAKELGARFLLLSNAAGCMNLDWKKGELMLVDDHINLQPENPLRGKNYESLGPRFPDMSAPYDTSLNGLLLEIAKEQGIPLHTGVYASVTGPNLETRAEYRYLKAIGADAVGMSTVPEVIVANHASLPCCAVSVLTDECDPDHLQPVDISEIIEIAGKAELKLTELYKELLKRIQ